GEGGVVQEDDEGTVARVEACRSVFSEKIQAHRGRVVDMAGDSILAVFETATGAVRAAFEIQGELAAPQRSASRKSPDAVPHRRQPRRGHRKAGRHRLWRWRKCRGAPG